MLKPFFYGLNVILFADLSVMCYRYRSYYGRTILNELDKSNDKNWIYDKNNHKYKEKKKIEKDLEIYEEQQEYNKIFNNLQNEDKIKNKTDKIVQNKNILRATIIIQNWWRHQLYEPLTGIFYKKSKESFVENMKK